MDTEDKDCQKNIWKYDTNGSQTLGRSQPQKATLRLVTGVWG
jgi:hypothetical protein